MKKAYKQGKSEDNKKVNKLLKKFKKTFDKMKIIW